MVNVGMPRSAVEPMKASVSGELAVPLGKVHGSRACLPHFCQNLWKGYLVIALASSPVSNKTAEMTEPITLCDA